MRKKRGNCIFDQRPKRTYVGCTDSERILTERDHYFVELRVVSNDRSLQQSSIEAQLVGIGIELDITAKSLPDRYEFASKVMYLMAVGSRVRIRC